MQEIITIDGFYQNIDQMKTLFSSMEYVKNENMLGGLICPMPYANEQMLEHFHNILNEKMGTFDFVEGSGSFIINSEEDKPLRNIGLQLPDLTTQWVVLVPLNLDESGLPHFLKFYRNRKTNWDKIPFDPEETAKYNLYNYPQIEEYIARENEDDSNWIETSRIELRPNQLIFFRPWLFHSYSDTFGDKQENSRLLQFFFLKPKQFSQPQEESVNTESKEETSHE